MVIQGSGRKSKSIDKKRKEKGKYKKRIKRGNKNQEESNIESHTREGRDK